jgi:hypothetical protein
MIAVSTSSSFFWWANARSSETLLASIRSLSSTIAPSAAAALYCCSNIALGKHTSPPFSRSHCRRRARGATAPFGRNRRTIDRRSEPCQACCRYLGWLGQQAVNWFWELLLLTPGGCHSSVLVVAGVQVRVGASIGVPDPLVGRIGPLVCPACPVLARLCFGHAFKLAVRPDLTLDPEVCPSGAPVCALRCDDQAKKKKRTRSSSTFARCTRTKRLPWTSSSRRSTVLSLSSRRPPLFEMPFGRIRVGLTTRQALPGADGSAWSLSVAPKLRGGGFPGTHPRTTSASCVGVSFGRRPPTRPRSRAKARPVLVRSRTIALSNSANEPSICISIRPGGLVVSMLSVKLQNPACRSQLRRE